LLIDFRQLLDLVDQALDLSPFRSLRKFVPVGREARQEAGGELVVDGILQRLEARVHAFDARGRRPELLHLGNVAPQEETLLQLVGQQEVLGGIELRRRLVELEELLLRRRHLLGTGEPAEGPQLRQLVLGVRLGEVLLEDVATDEIVVIRVATPLVDVAREDVAEVEALLREGLGPGRTVGRAEDRLLAARAKGAARAPDRLLRSTRADADVLGIWTLELPHREAEVLLEIVLLLRRELGCAKG